MFILLPRTYPVRQIHTVSARPMLLIYLSTPTYPILSVPCQMSAQDVQTRRVVYRDVDSRRFDQQGADKIG